MDSNGLSAYLSWLDEDVLGNYSCHKAELEDETKFKKRDISKLKWLVKDAKAFLEKASRRPATAVKVQDV